MANIVAIILGIVLIIIGIGLFCLGFITGNVDAERTFSCRGFIY